MGLMLAFVVTAGMIEIYVGRQIEGVNERWRAAAAPVFMARGKPEMATHANPEDLKRFLDPCYPTDYRERTLSKGCEKALVAP